MEWNLLWPILVVIASNTFYNICMKSTPADVNPFAALMVTYIISAIVSAIIFVFMARPENVASELSKVNWTSIILAFDRMVILFMGILYLVSISRRLLFTFFWNYYFFPWLNINTF